jgi:hypothetical protein
MLILMKTGSLDPELLGASRRRDLVELIAHFCYFHCEGVQIYQMTQLYCTVAHV